MNILINGGSKGIGRATVLKLSEASGNKLIITGRNELSLRSLSEASDFKNITWFGLDVTLKDERLKKLKNHIEIENIRLDVIINTVGYLKKSLFLKSDIKSAREMMEVNFFGPIEFIREMVPYLNTGSHIVDRKSVV